MIDMSFREKSTVLLLGILLLVYGHYFYDIWQASQTMAVEDIAYQTRMFTVVVVLVILGIIGNVVISALSPEDADTVDERDRAIERAGDQWGGYVLAGFALVAMGLAMTEQPHFYIAHNILAGLVLSEIVKSVLMLVHYRRGY